MSLPPLDLLLVGGRVHTLGEIGSSAVREAIGISGEHITALGRSADLMALAGETTTVVDLGGRCVVPGLVDAHTHLELSAYARHFWHDVRGLARGEILERVATLARDDAVSDWLVLQGTFGQDLPSRPELDGVAPKRPVAVRSTMHRFVLNTAGMKAAGLLDAHPPVGARLVRGDDGELSGVVDEGWDLLGWEPPTGPALAEALAETMAGQYLVHGVTTVYEVLASTDALAQYRLLAASGRLPLRLQAVATVAPGHQPTAELDSFGTLRVSRSLGDDWVRLSGIKIFLDGGRHGALRSSELGLPSQRWGLLTRTPTMLAHEVAAALSQDLQVWIHAIGDLSQRIALGSVEEAVRSTGVADHRTRIEHLGNELYEPARFEQLAELGIIAVPNPTFLYAEADDPAARIPPGVEKYVVRSLRGAGLRPPGNSDTAGSQPFATSPWFGVSCMTRRLNRNGVPVSPAEAVSVREAVAAYTSEAAFAGGEEARKGSLEPGKLADLAVLDGDPFSCPEEDLASVTSVLTVVGGRPAHVGAELAGAFVR